MNNWSLKPHSRKNTSTGKAFLPGERILSIIYMGNDGIMHRIDIHDQEVLPTDISEDQEIARWTRVLKEKEAEDKAEKQNMLQSTEELFLSLYQDADTAVLPENERDILKQLLGLMLERKRILKRVGEATEDFLTYVHVPTKKEYVVPLKDFSVEDIEKIKEQLDHVLR